LLLSIFTYLFYHKAKNSAIGNVAYNPSLVSHTPQPLDADIHSSSCEQKTTKIWKGMVFVWEKSRSLMAGVLILALTTSSALAASSFPDVAEDADYAPAVEYLNEIGVMSGDQNGNFNPDNTVTRAEMAAIVCRMSGETEDLPSDDRFPDVPVEHWANGYVSKAAELGIVTGYDTGLFGPTDTVTYEQAVTMIVRTFGGEEAAVEYGGYPDGYLSIAEEDGLLTGVFATIGTPLPRSDVAKLLYNHYWHY